MSEESPIIFKYDCTAAELREGFGLVKSRKLKRRKNSVSLLTYYAIGFVIIALDLWNQLQSLSDSQGIATFSRLVRAMPRELWMEVVVAAGMACLIVALVLERILRRIPHERFKNQLTFTIGTQGLISQRPGYASLRSWTLFRSVDENARLFLLWTSAKQSIVLPKRLFADAAEVERAGRLLRQYTTRSAIPVSTAFPVVTHED